jgi:hypothetical protein
VGDEIHHVEARNVLALQEIDGVGIFLAEDGDEHVGSGDFLLAGRLDVQDRPLNHPLKTQGGLGVNVFRALDLGRVFIHEVGQFLAQFVGLCAAQARRTSAAEGLSRSASRRCSTVMNSWRFCLASTKAMCRLTSSSCAIISVFLHDACQGMLVLACVRDDLLDLGCGDVPRKDSAHTNALSVDFEHDPRRLFAVHGKEFLYHGHHEIHGGEIVIKEHDFVERRRLDPRDL